VTAAAGGDGGLPIEAVLFDFGNTLFGHSPLTETVAAAARRLAAPLTDADCVALAAEIDAAAMHPDERARGRDLDAAVWRDRWAVLYGLGDRHARGLGAAVDALMHDPAQWHPYAATRRVLRALRVAGVPVAVVSNTGWDVRAVFDFHGLGDQVDAFVLSCEVGAVKPDPTVFRLAAEALAVRQGAALMVGDDAIADGGAVTAGLRVLLLPQVSPGADNGLDAVTALASLQDRPRPR
jgi:FMN phosphatase YigB (HAD superfamily)